MIGYDMKKKVYLIFVILSFLVLSCGGGGGGGSSSPNNAPPIPQNILSASGNSQVYLSWENATGATSYNIYWSTKAGVSKQNGTKIPTRTSPYYHAGLNNNTTYYYVVTSVNQYGESDVSTEVSSTPSQINPALPPKEVKAFAFDKQTLIRWTVVDVEETGISYNIYWSLSRGVTKESGIKIANAITPYNHDGLTNGKIYYYVVTGVNQYGEGIESQEVSATPDQGNAPFCVAMGDSITAGYAATTYANSYVPLLSNLWGKKIINEGMDGASSSYGVQMIDQFLSQYNPPYITIYFGSNDVGFIDPDSTISNLQYMIERAKNNGTIPVVATLGPFFYQWAWRKPYAIDLNQRIRQLAASERIACADLEAALNWNSDYIIDDGMHPNDEGHQTIAETFYKALTQ